MILNQFLYLFMYDIISYLSIGVNGDACSDQVYVECTPLGFGEFCSVPLSLTSPNYGLTSVGPPAYSLQLRTPKDNEDGYDFNWQLNNMTRDDFKKLEGFRLEISRSQSGRRYICKQLTVRPLDTYDQPQSFEFTYYIPHSELEEKIKGDESLVVKLYLLPLTEDWTYTPVSAYFYYNRPYITTPIPELALITMQLEAGVSNITVFIISPWSEMMGMSRQNISAIQLNLNDRFGKVPKNIDGTQIIRSFTANEDNLRTAENGNLETVYSLLLPGEYVMRAFILVKAREGENAVKRRFSESVVIKGVMFKDIVKSSMIECIQEPHKRTLQIHFPAVPKDHLFQEKYSIRIFTTKYNVTKLEHEFWVARLDNEWTTATILYGPNHKSRYFNGTLDHILPPGKYGVSINPFGMSDLCTNDKYLYECGEEMCNRCEPVIKYFTITEWLDEQADNTILVGVGVGLGCVLLFAIAVITLYVKIKSQRRFSNDDITTRITSYFTGQQMAFIDPEMTDKSICLIVYGSEIGPYSFEYDIGMKLAQVFEMFDRQVTVFKGDNFQELVVRQPPYIFLIVTRQLIHLLRYNRLTLPDQQVLALPDHKKTILTLLEQDNYVNIFTSKKDKPLPQLVLLWFDYQPIPSDFPARGDGRNIPHKMPDMLNQLMCFLEGYPIDITEHPTLVEYNNSSLHDELEKLLHRTHAEHDLREQIWSTGSSLPPSPDTDPSISSECKLLSSDVSNINFINTKKHNNHSADDQENESDSQYFEGMNNRSYPHNSSNDESSTWLLGDGPSDSGVFKSEYDDRPLSHLVAVSESDFPMSDYSTSSNDDFTSTSRDNSETTETDVFKDKTEATVYEGDARTAYNMTFV